MSGYDVRMDYEAMEELIRQAQNMGETFEGMIRSAEFAAKKIEGGGLVNQQGRAWVEQIRQIVIPYLRRQQDKYEELARDLNGAVRDLRDGDSAARSRFSG